MKGLKNSWSSVLIFSGFCILTSYTRVVALANVVDTDPYELYRTAKEIHDRYPDSALNSYRQAMEQFQFLSRDVAVIKCQVSISDIYKNKGHYHRAFDELWDAQILAEEIADTISLITIYEDLGGLYSIYEKYDDAIANFETALKLSQLLSGENQFVAVDLNQIYYALAVTHRKAEFYEKALDYLDLCLAVKVKKNIEASNTAFIDAEKGIIYLKQNKLQLAEQYLRKAHAFFVQRSLSYRIFTSLFLGDMYYQRGDLEEANRYYRYSLESQEKSKSHGDSKVEILKKLSDTYHILGQTDSAYKYQVQALAITDSLFNAKTAVNNQLFGIRDKHDEKIRARDQFIAQQHLIIERNQTTATRLKLLIGFLLFAAIVTIVILRMRKKLRNSRLEQEQIKMEAEHDREKARAIMEVKSKELTANTLQMIEKDRVVEELLQELKKESPGTYRAMKARVSKGNKDMWEHFNKRFIEVDTRFYERLRARHPDLTPTEHRHCALIKLNFDSKEMASLLGISVNSVHISRHRIRKKMGLERDDNLTSHIAGI
ncbi:tetratricopeptide repeat protein [Marinoscillum furvescens]|uniref:HTH luxR-type domain-containing protein n=1 Tax=Marinoscillum furvescens DSM 4134 TaxID=1122208 RepID=A0A3D9KZJ4_MARFU|nr:hypothetical protein [Marinoscillum furvescens]RED95980.1 hypothetical protein C7460_11638 [Marinoscillum furvescens DSM 4134]